MSQSREQFEARYPVPAGVRWCEESSRYALVEIKTARHAGSTIAGYEVYVHSWSVWKASREDVVVKLPDAVTYHDGSEITRAVIDADKLAESLESAGLRVSP